MFGAILTGLLSSCTTPSTSSSTSYGAVDSTLTGRSISCSSSANCVIGGFDQSYDGAVAVSNDAGLSWKRVRITANYTLINGISCPTDNYCVVIGQNRGFDGLVFVSSDGGQHWSRPIDVGSTIGQTVVCMSTSNCVAAGQNNKFDSATAYSTDGGRSWKQSSISMSSGEIHQIVCPSSSRCIAIGDSNALTGGVWLSSDMGREWVLARQQFAEVELMGIACMKGSICIAVGVGSQPRQGVVLESENAGSTWHPVNLQSPNAVPELTSVACTLTGQCVATVDGSSGLELYSNSRGLSWSLRPSGTARFYSASCDLFGTRHLP